MSNWAYQQHDSIGDEITIKGTHTSGNWSLNFHVDAYYAALFEIIDNTTGCYVLETEGNRVWLDQDYKQFKPLQEWLAAHFDNHTQIDTIIEQLDRCI